MFSRNLGIQTSGCLPNDPEAYRCQAKDEQRWPGSIAHRVCLPYDITHLLPPPLPPPPLPRTLEFLHYVPQLNSCVSLELSPLCAFVCVWGVSTPMALPSLLSHLCIYPTEQAELTPETQASWVKGLTRAIASLGHSGLSEESGRLQGHCRGEGVSRESSILGRRSK